MDEAGNLSSGFRIEDGRKFRLADHNPDAADSRYSKESADEPLSEIVSEISRLQNLLWAQDRWALLLIFQGIDAAGKDSAIKRVMSGVNPQGCEVTSFKEPSQEELDHDYLWRATRRLPERGRIGIFNRSYYEEVLVVRVHPELLEKQKTPSKYVTEALWRQRFADMVALEDFLVRNGTVVLKFFLNISKAEQRKRFLKRLDDPEKNWKFSARDVHERDFWDGYMHAYEDMVRHTSTAGAPWYVVPADRKWFAHLVIADAIVKAMSDLGLEYPKISGDELLELEEAKKALLAEDG
jgi:PPK2 family polyphosphate:nucleotide phosphotransferase